MGSLVVRNIGGTEYTFDPSKSHLLQRGLFEVYDEGRRGDWIGMKEVRFWSHRLQRGIVIPQWFVTDFASIPKPARWLISVNEEHRYAALPHDLFYCCDKLGLQRPSRREADLVLLDFCKVMNVPEWKQTAIYSAVRVGGGPAWRKSEKTVLVPERNQPRYRLAHPELFCA